MLLNGGHRVASCLVFDKPICFQTGGEGQAHVDYNYFKNKNDFLEGGLEEKYCDSKLINTV